MIDILIPSRGRYNRLLQTLQSAKDTAQDADGIHAIIFLDEDDAHNYDNLHVLRKTTVITGAQDVLSKHWNTCFAYGNGKIVMHAADDIIFESDGWDRIVEDHFNDVNDEIICLYGQDGHQDKNCPTHSFTSRRAANIIGHFLPPYFAADGNDVWLQTVYAGIDRLIYDPRIITRHLHVNVDAKYNDDTYKLASERRKGVSAEYEKRRGEITDWINKLKNA